MADKKQVRAFAMARVCEWVFFMGVVLIVPSLVIKKFGGEQFKWAGLRFGVVLLVYGRYAAWSQNSAPGICAS